MTSEMPREIWAQMPASSGDAMDVDAYTYSFPNGKKYHHDDKVQGLVEALESLIELQDSALSLDVRAKGIDAPEDAHIKQLCEHYGYGAVMDSAARQWHLKCGIPNGSGHTTYHCYSVVKKVTQRAIEVLTEWRKENEV